MGYGAVQVYGTNTSTGNITTSETTLGTFTLDSNELSKSTDAIHVVAWGTLANNANAKTVTLYFGSASQAFVLPTSVGTGWKLDAWFSSLTPTSQTGVAHMQASVIASATSDVFVITATENTHNTIVVKITGTATSTNDILLKGMLVLD